MSSHQPRHAGKPCLWRSVSLRAVNLTINPSPELIVLEAIIVSSSSSSAYNSRISQGSLVKQLRKWSFLLTEAHKIIHTHTHTKMSFACLVCHSVDSPSHSFRSYSVSSSDNEGRCSVIASCLSRTSLIQAARSNTFPASSSSKVTPQPNFQGSDLMITEGASPRLVRSRAVRRDIVRDWNFNETETEL